MVGKGETKTFRLDENKKNPARRISAEFNSMIIFTDRYGHKSKS